jgi:hypothetical protein
VAQTFSERIATRSRLWWDAPRPGSGRTLRDAAHRLIERHAVRRRDDPDSVWRCCEAWPRTLVDKWNGREFAAKHGCTLPELFARVGPFSRPQLDTLPGHFVVRPARSAKRREVLVVAEGREILRDRPATAAELRRELAPWRRLGAPVALVIEDFVRAEDGSHRPPVELKCHTFAGTVAAIDVIQRTSLKADSRLVYTPDWEPFKERIMDTALPRSEPRDPPAGLAEMLALASRLGADLGTYMRIDFFASEGGCVFNEFSNTPRGGRDLTPYANELFGSLWEEKCPGAI